MVEHRSITLIGAGDHGLVVLAALQASGARVGTVLDDDEALRESELLGIRVSGPVREHSREDALAVVAVGDNAIRRRLVRELRLEWHAVVHPAAWVHESAEIGPGAMIMAGAVVQPQARIGAHAIVNTGATVDHHCEVGPFAHVAPGANLAGRVIVGEGTLVGVGSSTIPRVRIGAWATIGAGSVVVRDIPDGAVARGVPARVARGASSPEL